MKPSDFFGRRVTIPASPTPASIPTFVLCSWASMRSSSRAVGGRRCSWAWCPRAGCSRGRAYTAILNPGFGRPGVRVGRRPTGFSGPTRAGGADPYTVIQPGERRHRCSEISPEARANRASSHGLQVPNFRPADRAWASIVRTLRCNALAISTLLKPSARMASTTDSDVVSLATRTMLGSTALTVSGSQPSLGCVPSSTPPGSCAPGS